MDKNVPEPTPNLPERLPPPGCPLCYRALMVLADDSLYCVGGHAWLPGKLKVVP